MDEKKRNINLDALRTFAIIGVVTLHFVGGVNTLKLNVGNRLFVNVLLAITYTSVNLFGMLSGYLKIERSNHSASIIKIITQAIFWCFSITIIYGCFFDFKSVWEIINYAFPFMGDRLWYITCYFFVFICAPYLNILVSRLSQSGYAKLLVFLALLMSLIPTLCFRDFFHIVNNGYSAGWLIFMYLIGGYFKKYGFLKIVSKRIVIIVLWFSLFLVVVSKYLIGISQMKVSTHIDFSWCLYYYNSPLTLLNSTCFFYLFVNGKWRANGFGKLITWISSVSLGIYIIHAHPYCLDNLLCGKKLEWTVNDNPFVTLFVLIGSIISICFVLGILDWVRSKLFKICGINRWIEKQGKKLDKVLEIKVID